MNDRAALELALAANPDDFATHAAYADLLTEQGNPRGDYIRLQLALEDRHQPVERLRAMEQEAFTIRNAHEVEWLGPLYTHVNPGAGFHQPGVNINVLEANVQVTYRRGWIDTVRVRELIPGQARALRGCPVGRLIRELSVESCHLESLGTLPLSNLRRLRLGGLFVEGGTSAEPEPGQGGWFHPVSPPVARALATIPRALPRLEELAYRVMSFGDEGVDFLLATGVVGRLRGLDLSGCGITDDGAHLLAADPAVPKLDYLTLDHNSISPIGIDALAAVGVAISQRQYLGPMAGDDTESADEEIAF
jgi:uncharacterized protein (TIGR02996 family)